MKCKNFYIYFFCMYVSLCVWRGCADIFLLIFPDLSPTTSTTNSKHQHRTTHPRVRTAPQTHSFVRFFLTLPAELVAARGATALRLPAMASGALVAPPPASQSLPPTPYPPHPRLFSGKTFEFFIHVNTASMTKISCKNAPFIRIIPYDI